MPIKDMLKDKIMLSSIILATTAVSFIALGMLYTPTLYLIGGIFFVATGIVGLIWACVRKRWVGSKMIASDDRKTMRQKKIVDPKQEMVDELRGISPRLARMIARHRPEVKRILEGESEPTERKTTNKEKVIKIFKEFKETIRKFKGSILIIAVAFNATIILVAFSGALDVYYKDVLLSGETVTSMLLMFSIVVWSLAGGIWIIIEECFGKGKKPQLTHEELEQKIRDDVKRISPETARRIAKYIPKIESMLRGENNLDKP